MKVLPCPKCQSLVDRNDLACENCGLQNPLEPDALNWQPVGRLPDQA